MTSNAHELGAPVGAWNAVVRRARIGRERKAAALVVSSYARADGTRIHCGVARLAVDLEVSYSTAKRALAWLRKVGLIELVRAGNRRRNLSDEYRLILGPDVMEDVEILDPAEHKRLADGIREANRGSFKSDRNEPVDNSECGSSMVTPDPAETTENCGSSMVTPKNATAGQMGVDCGSSKDDPPSLRYISPKDLSPRKTTEEAGLGARVTVGAAEVPAPVVEIFPGASQEARYRPAPRWSTSAMTEVEAATARRLARVAAHQAQIAAESKEIS